MERVEAINAILKHGNEKKAAAHFQCAVTHLYSILPKGDVVYIIEAIGLVKVGTASGRRVASRLRDIQAMSPAPIKLIALIDGDRLVERDLHLRWAGHRHHGEWFTFDDEIADYVAALKGDDR